MTWSGCLALLDVQEWSGAPDGWPRMVERPFRMSGSGREAIPNVQEW